MMATNYQRGVAAERRVIADAEKRGARWPCRSAGSHGPWDVFTIEGTTLFLRQVKRKGARIDAEDMRIYRRFAREVRRVKRITFEIIER